VRRLLVCFGAAALLISGCGGGSSSSSATTATSATTGNAVELKGIAFNPATVVIKAGTTVVWTWNDGIIPHNVTGPDFKSGDKFRGTYQHTFTTAGTVHYQCTIHAGMTGTVVVQ